MYLLLTLSGHRFHCQHSGCSLTATGSCQQRTRTVNKYTFLHVQLMSKMSVLLCQVLFRRSHRHYYPHARCSSLPAAGSSSVTPGNFRRLTACFVACRYGDRAPERVAMDIMFAPQKETSTPQLGDTTLRLQTLRVSDVPDQKHAPHYEEVCPKCLSRFFPMISRYYIYVQLLNNS